MGQILELIMRHITKDMTTFVALGAGLLITACVTISYFRRKRKDSTQDEPTPLSPSESSINADRVDLAKESPTENETDIINVDNQYVEELLQKLSSEAEMRMLAEEKAKHLENELKTQATKAKISQEKFEKLSKRFNVVSKKLKLTEHRCQTLLEAMDNDDEDDIERAELLPLAEDSDMSDEAEVEEYVESVLGCKPSQRKNHEDDMEVSEDYSELGQDVIQALLATAVDDMSDFRLSGLIQSGYDEDDDDLSDILADNMESGDLDEVIGQIRVKVDQHPDNGHMQDNEEDEEIISEPLQDVKSARQFWEQRFAGDESPTASRKSDSSDAGDSQRLSPNQHDLELQRSSPFQELRKQWNRGSSQESDDCGPVVQKKESSNLSVRTLDYGNVSPTPGAKNEYVDDQHSPNFKTLKQQWEQMAKAPPSDDDDEVAASDDDIVDVESDESLDAEPLELSSDENIVLQNGKSEKLDVTNVVQGDKNDMEADNIEVHNINTEHEENHSDVETKFEYNEVSDETNAVMDKHDLVDKENESQNLSQNIDSPFVVYEREESTDISDLLEANMQDSSVDISLSSGMPLESNKNIDDTTDADNLDGDVSAYERRKELSDIEHESGTEKVDNEVKSEHGEINKTGMDTGFCSESQEHSAESAGEIVKTGMDTEFHSERQEHSSESAGAVHLDLASEKVDLNLNEKQQKDFDQNGDMEDKENIPANMIE